jgi:hypothetical protein
MIFLNLIPCFNSVDSGRVRGMAAAISATAILRRKRSMKVPKSIANEPLSFHVTFLLGRDFVLPAGLSSVDVLRKPLYPHIKSEPSSEAFEGYRRLMRSNSQAPPGNSTAKVPNLTGTKLELWTKKFKSSQSSNEDNMESAWQERLVIVTEKRIFLITEKQNTVSDQRAHDSPVPTQRTSKKVEYEIVESIPMEEIISIELDDPAMIVSDPESIPTMHHTNSFFSRNIIRSASSLLKRNRSTTQLPDAKDASVHADAGTGPSPRRAGARSTGSRQALPAGAGEDYCEQVRLRRGVRDRAAGAAGAAGRFGLLNRGSLRLETRRLARPRRRSVLGLEPTYLQFLNRGIFFCYPKHFGKIIQ